MGSLPIWSRLSSPRASRNQEAIRLSRPLRFASLESSVRRLKADADHDITVSGPELAAHAIRAGLVDEFQMIVCPVLVGSGKRFFPDGVRLNLELIDERRFRDGVVFLRYTVGG
jgi:dihydrofolate reductase